MNARDAIKLSVDSGDMISMMYLQDLTDQEMLHRPCQGANHINWQVGHLIASEHKLIEGVAPGSMPNLPAGFTEKYSQENTEVDDPAKLEPKEKLLAIYKQQREATLAALAKQSDDDLDKPTGMDWAPTVASVFSMQGPHWLMHAGQWVVVRRQLGRKPMF